MVDAEGPIGCPSTQVPPGRVPPGAPAAAAASASAPHQFSSPSLRSVIGFGYCPVQTLDSPSCFSQDLCDKTIGSSSFG